MELNDLDTITIAKAVKEAAMKKARNGLEGGTEHNIDLTIRIHGTVKVGEDYEQRIIYKVDFPGLLALALSKTNNVTMDALVREFEETEAVDTDAIKKNAAEALNAIKAKSMMNVKGKVTTKLNIEKVGIQVE